MKLQMTGYNFEIQIINCAFKLINIEKITDTEDYENYENKAEMSKNVSNSKFVYNMNTLVGDCLL